MSSTAAPKRFFCHQCDRTVTIPSPPPPDLTCPVCQGGFIEEFDIPTPTPNPNPNPSHNFVGFDPFEQPFFPPFPFAGGQGGQGGGVPADHFNPMQFLQTYLNAMMGDGHNVQIVFEGGNGGGNFHNIAGGNFGDYFIGPGFEQLIQQLAENDPNRYGTPPAAKDAVGSLPDIEITEDLKRKDNGDQCAVCKDEFDAGSLVKQMPCTHLYHKECILPWLELHNSCPVCRYELPTDDQDYENGRRGSGGGSNASDVSSNSGGGGGGTERRFRIQLPWPFRSSSGGTQGEGSNAGSGGGNGGGSGRTETRQEDLD